MVFSTLYEILVDFTRDYDLIRAALTKIEHYDKTAIENMLQTVKSILLTNWGSQNYSQVLVFTDCGIGIGNTSLKSTIATIKQNQSKPETKELSCLPFSFSSKLSFVCLGSTTDSYFKIAIALYQQLLDVSGQKGCLFVPKRSDELDFVKKEAQDTATSLVAMMKTQILSELIGRVCETNYKPFEAVLKCGGNPKLESHIVIWPPPLPYDTTKQISRRLEICGFLGLSEIGSPMSVSRHLILPRPSEHTDKTANSTAGGKYIKQEGATEYEKLESFLMKTETTDDDTTATIASSSPTASATQESVCVLLHGALKVENMAALVLLNDDWFGFIYSYADSKKKSNLMLTVLPPGHDGIPWLGDIRFIGTVDDLLPSENAGSFPVKPEKRSYSQNCVVWIKPAGLQSDIQKVLRHAKKLPEKTQNFYKELNRIRRAALSLGFVELLEGLSGLFEREISMLPPNASPDCAIQLKHTATELLRLNNRDPHNRDLNLKAMITALPTKYNQL